MLDTPIPCPTLSMAARRVYIRAKWRDHSILVDPAAAYHMAYITGENPALAHDIADLRNKLSLKIEVQAEHPTPARAAQICALSERLAALETTATRLDGPHSPTR